MTKSAFRVDSSRRTEQVSAPIFWVLVKGWNVVFEVQQIGGQCHKVAVGANLLSRSFLFSFFLFNFSSRCVYLVFFPPVCR